MDSTAPLAGPLPSYRYILHEGDPNEPVGEGTLPFPPYPRLHVVDPRDNCFAEILVVCWCPDELAFLLEIAGKAEFIQPEISRADR